MTGFGEAVVAFRDVTQKRLDEQKICALMTNLRHVLSSRTTQLEACEP